MALKGYFANIPSIEYGTKIARNLNTRPRIKEQILKNPHVIYDYVIQDGERPDLVANGYYGNPNFVWLIFLANNIIDPYYDWPLNTNQMQDFLKDKYGSLAEAQSKIVHYKHKTKSTIISKETKDLNSTFGKINENDYSPVYAYDNEIEINEAKRTIKLIDRRLASTAYEALRDAMIEND